jgi:6-pyruvoyl-tetrahydropterin synthase
VSRRATIKLRHNVEMGHRLSEQPNSKCFHLHGHSWNVELSISGVVDAHGMVIDFGRVKKEMRTYLDTLFDHHLCLNVKDPLVTILADAIDDECPPLSGDRTPGELIKEWGITIVQCDPTVENMARIWGEHMRNIFGQNYGYVVEVSETKTNSAVWEG